MEAKIEKAGAWLRDHRWEMTLVILALALLGWAMPLYQSVPVALSVVSSGEEYAAEALSSGPLPVWLSTLFDGGTNWAMVLPPLPGRLRICAPPSWLVSSSPS